MVMIMESTCVKVIQKCVPLCELMGNELTLSAAESEFMPNDGALRKTVLDWADNCLLLVLELSLTVRSRASSSVVDGCF